MDVLILGGGGREHALAWKIAQSELVDTLYCAPGNAGIAGVATCVGDLDIEDGAAVVAFARQNAIGFVVVGPEAPLAAGVADALRAAEIGVFGPNRDAALRYVREQGAPIVIKADGLAAGKGVVVAMTLPEAEDAVDHMFSGAFGEAGAEVVVEEFMAGEETSYFVLTDGEAVLPLPTAQDHKRAYDGDEGPNTGGMGAYSPAPVLTEELQRRAMDEIVLPIIRELERRGMRYRGVLYAGLMIGDQGPRLVEINARFGDPECQPLMLRLNSDILPALMACDGDNLSDIALEWSPDPALSVVMATKGYPGSYEKGEMIGGLDAAGDVEGVTVFHAGTRTGANGIEAAGGRVLNVTATGDSVKQARDRAYQAVDRIDWQGGFCRADIAWRILAKD